MTATVKTAGRGSDAAHVFLRVDRFEELCVQRGATTGVAQAELVGSDRTTVYRLRRGQISPSGELMMRWADRLGVAVEDLWEQRDRPGHPKPAAPRPSNPPARPRPPAGPATPTPPAGPKTGDAE